MKPWHFKIEVVDLCPVTTLICLASTLWSDRTVTVVTQTQWLIKWRIIEAASDIVFIIFPRVDVPIGELQVFFSLELREFTLGVGKEFLIQDSGDLSNFALFLPGKHFAI